MRLLTTLLTLYALSIIQFDVIVSHRKKYDAW